MYDWTAMESMVALRTRTGSSVTDPSTMRNERISVTFGSRWRYVGRTSSLAEYRRESVARVPNALRQLAQLPWFVRNVIVKIGIVTGFKPLARLMGHRGDY